MTPAAVQQLLRMQAAAAANRLLAPEDGAALAAAIGKALAGEPLEAALGLPPDWRRSVAVDERAIALMLLAADVPAGSGHSVAKAIESRVRRYAATAWRVDRRRGFPALESDRAAFQLLRAPGGKILGWSRIRQILNDIGGQN